MFGFSFFFQYENMKIFMALTFGMLCEKILKFRKILKITIMLKEINKIRRIFYEKIRDYSPEECLWLPITLVLKIRKKLSKNGVFLNSTMSLHIITIISLLR